MLALPLPGNRRGGAISLQITVQRAGFQALRNIPESGGWPEADVAIKEIYTRPDREPRNSERREGWGSLLPGGSKSAFASELPPWPSRCGPAGSRVTQGAFADREGRRKERGPGQQGRQGGRRWAQPASAGTRAPEVAARLPSWVRRVVRAPPGGPTALPATLSLGRNAKGASFVTRQCEHPTNPIPPAAAPCAREFSSNHRNEGHRPAVTRARRGTS